MRTPARPPILRRRLLLYAHLLVTGLVLVDGGWLLMDTVKRRFVGRAVGPVLPWADLFRHPRDAALPAYVAAALVALSYGLLLYLRLRPPFLRKVRTLRRTACGRYPVALGVVTLAQYLVVAPGHGQVALALASLAACVLPLPRWRIPRPRPSSPGVRRWLDRASRPVALLSAAATVAVLVGLATEPVKLAFRPLQLLNEYDRLPQRWRVSPDRPRPAVDACEFAVEDPVEFAYQAHNRGPINHIGHILNPINELETGKPARDIYFQYGRGATLAFKWMMDRFGGASLQAYRKTFLFYVAYWLVFAAGVWLLFRDARYVLASVALLAASYYNLGYEPLILAPGVNPILHFLDVPVLLLALRLFRSGAGRWLAAAAAGAVGAVALNPFFGGMVAIALLVSAGLHAIETAAPGRALRRLAAVVAAVLGPLVVVAAATPRSGGGDVITEFLDGYFSWAPRPGLVLFALAYLTAGYGFLLWARDRRDPLKYAAVFLFVYAQGLLVYFFWSGLENHFWPVLPYVGLHVLLMLSVVARAGALRGAERWVIAGVLAGVFLVGRIGIGFWIHNRAEVRRAFEVHQTWAWPFERAAVVSTADPAPLAASVAQLERWAPGPDRGVAILSVFDDLVPFLARRHSVLPHFELQWALLTEADRAHAVEVLERARPPVLFVGHELETDPAAPEYAPCAQFARAERQSQAGRLREMRRVFLAVAGDYQLAESGPLLSVYQRRDLTAAARSTGSRAGQR